MSADQAVRIYEYGGPEVLRYEEVAVAAPAAGELRIRHSAIGLNYIDIYQRSGLYQLPSLPWTLGMEGAGVVEALGAGVTGFQVGDRVAYASAPAGAYATRRLIAAERVVALPPTIDERSAAAMLLQGMTAHYLLHRTYRVQRGTTILLHAAAGGVGLLLAQWARHLGALVIGTVGSAAKAQIAQAHGCHHTIIYTSENFVQRVREITDGQGVDVVYDAVGKDTFTGSLDCLRRLGMLVSFGNASGAVAAFEPGILSAKGSLFLTRPTLMDYTADPADLQASAQALFEVVSSGAVRVEIGQTYPLCAAAQAQRDLQARKTTGSTILLPE